MAKIIFIEHNGTVREVQAQLGQSLMDVAVKTNLPGIAGDCGGACACATCHVYIEPDWVERAGPRSEMEDNMLEFANDVQPNSRLACQIKVEAALDGLTLRTPASQY